MGPDPGAKRVLVNSEFQVDTYLLFCLYSTELLLVLPPLNMNSTVSALSKEEAAR